MYFDKRKRSRVQYNIEVTLKTPLGEKVGYTQNVSLNGVLIKLDSDLPVGIPCSVHFNVPFETGDLSIKGVVVRSNKGETGIKFSKLSPEAFSYLQNVLYHYLGDTDRVDQELKEDAF